MRYLILALAKFKAKLVTLFIICALIWGLGIFLFSPATFLELRDDYALWRGGFYEKSLVVEDQTLSYLENDTTGNNIVMLHSFGSKKENFVKFANGFTHKYRIYLIDMPGFGASSQIQGADYRVPAQQRRIVAFLDKKGIKKAHFIGNSFGALNAAAMAYLKPERVLSIALLAPPGAASAELSTTMKIALETGRNAFAVRNEKEYREMLYLLFHNPPWVPGHFISHLTQEAMEKRPFLDYMLSQLKAGPVNFEPFMANIKVPTLILWGEFDQVLHVSGAEVFHKGIDSSQRIIIKECGHACHVEKTQVTSAHYKHFLNQVEDALKLSENR